jgi:hypothetical protein
MAVGQVLWEDAELHGFVVEPLERFEQTCSTLSSLRNASTWGEVRAAELAPWAREFVEDLAVSREEDLERPVDDAERWSYEEVSESVVDRVPLSHDAASTQAWLGRDLLEAHARISGSSPGGTSTGTRCMIVRRSSRPFGMQVTTRFIARGSCKSCSRPSRWLLRRARTLL